MITVEEKEEFFITFNKDETKALRKIKEKYKFKNLESALRFGLAIMIVEDRKKWLQA